jgi:hypothetical protein
VTGVDATAEIVAELDRLSAMSEVARNAPRSKALYRYLANGMQAAATSIGTTSDEFSTLTYDLILRLGIWWSPETYRRLPVLTPWCVRDRSCRYDQGPESWGAPRADGYLRDDNSIIKKLPLGSCISAPYGHPYVGRKPWRGFTACHIWRDMPDGSMAGADPWLYSFAPNLVWLPSWLAPLTDRQGSVVQQILQRTSIALFRDASVAEPLAPYTERAWRQLLPPTAGPKLSLARLATFEPDEGFVARRVAYLNKFVIGCDSVLSTGQLTAKLICSRYTVGLPLLDTSAVRAFRDAMNAYRDAVEGARIPIAVSVDEVLSSHVGVQGR